MAVIPGGLTSVLQPLDVCLNKPFKDRLCKMWVEWMISGLATLTKGGNLQKPDITVEICKDYITVRNFYILCRPYIYFSNHNILMTLKIKYFNRHLFVYDSSSLPSTVHACASY